MATLAMHATKRQTEGQTGAILTAPYQVVHNKPQILTSIQETPNINHY